jgi:hypothetical protein
MAAPSVLRVVVGLAAALGLAVLAAHPAVRRLERRLGLTVLVSSGLPFLAMGVLFRQPSVGVLTDDVVADLRPALEFGLGWLGFVVGMQFDVRELDDMPDRLENVVFAESGLPFAATTLTCLLALFALGRSPQLGVLDRDSLRDALALGACAAPAAPVAAVAIARSAGSVAAGLVARVTSLNDVAGVVVLALICAFFRPSDELSPWKLPHVAWLLVTLGLGGILGILTYVLLRSAHGLAEEMAYLLGAIGLSAGMAGYLAISPLVPCCIAGALLTNLPLSDRASLRATIVQVERPLYLIFLLVAGASWDARSWQGWVLVPLFVLSRVGGKIAGARLAVRTGPRQLPDAGTLGLALSPQSPIAIATVVSYTTLYRPASPGFVDWLTTAVVGGAVVTELGVQAIARMRGGLRFDRPSLVSVPPPPPGEAGGGVP